MEPMPDDAGLNNPLDQLRLSVMQEVLPVGLAVLERARQGGAAKVVEAFTTGSDDPMANLRQEGEPAARSVRDQLDAVSPGLGNPVMPVDVSVEAPSQDRGDLIETMQRIEQRLQALKGHLQGN
jgi:hypothetical protein